MRLLLQTYYVGSFDDPCEMTHVLVDVDLRHQLDMRAKLSGVLAMPQCYSVTFFDDTPQSVLCEFSGDEPDWFDEEAEFLAIPDDVSPPLADFRIEAPTIRYTPNGIMWHLYERHGGERYETATVPWEFIQTAAKQNGGNRVKISR